MIHQAENSFQINERPRLLHAGLTGEVISAAVEVHRELGPGLLESAYQACLCHELATRRIDFRTEVALPADYKGYPPGLRL